MKISPNFSRSKASETGRTLVQLTSGPAFCYPLYYFIPSLSADQRYLVHHRAENGSVQLHRLDLATGESVQLTHASCPETRWIPWCVDSGAGVLDHRSVLNVAGNEVIYFDGNDVRAVHLETLADRRLFVLPDDRLAIGQNCVTPDGEWLIYIHHDRKIFNELYPLGKPWERHKSRGTVLAAYHLTRGEHREIFRINSPIHHVLPLDNDRFVACHPATEDGMLMTDLRGGWYTHLRTQDKWGKVCHYLCTTRGLMYEVRQPEDPRIKSQRGGIYDPDTHERFEFPLPESFGYTHTGWDPEGRLWMYENRNSINGPDGKPTSVLRHDLWFVRRADESFAEIEPLCGDFPTYGLGQKSHFHPQLLPGREWVMLTGGDPATETNHIFLLDVRDVPDAIVSWEK